MAKNTTANESQNGEREEEVQSNWVGWGKVGNTIKGTLIGVGKMKSKYPDKPDQAFYEIKVTEGEFNNVDKKTKVCIEPSIVVQAGDIYNVGGRLVIDRQMKNIRLGTKIRLRYTEDKASKEESHSDQKIIKVLVVRDANNQPVMDQVWLDEQTNEAAVRAF